MRLYEDLRVVQNRLAALQALVVVLLVALVIQFWNLQVVRARHFRELAENNRSRLVVVAAPRGALLDRKGVVLVGNRPSFNVVLNTERLASVDRLVSRLAGTLGVGEAQIRERLAHRQPYQPLVLKSDASLADVAALEARRLELPEVSIEVVPLRSYPLASAAAHALGRIGEITERQLQSPEYQSISAGSLVGQAGVEYRYNRQLMGKDGYLRVIVNSRGQETGVAERLPPVDGPSLALTIDAGLQAAMERAFAGRAGSAVALDPYTGEILAMASTPAYDPNSFATGIDAAMWASLATDPQTPLINRVIQGTYSPGSTFKLVTSTAALEEGVITPATTFFCPGQATFYGNVFHCHKKGGHGTLDLKGAIANSCNVYFYNVGVRLEIQRIAKWAKAMGLGAPTGIDLPNEGSGIMPSPEWKMRLFKQPWYAGETVSVAIGQGQVSVTPLQMARVAAVIANGGKLVKPHLVRGAPNTEPVDLGIKPSSLEAVRDGMLAVVAGGTGHRAALTGITVAGKTGTAQVVARARLEKSPNSPEMLPHGWFLCFAPAEHPTIAMAVLVEHGKSGAEGAAPVAHEILAEWFGLTRTEPPLAPGMAPLPPAVAGTPEVD
ncbi:MAG TPA: penicillin-binding protein 2 [Vicinamibacteria bacterium]|nr:penicillin-binding protein 2 [Vicinamibacteria bacterium]